MILTIFYSYDCMLHLFIIFTVVSVLAGITMHSVNKLIVK